MCTPAAVTMVAPSRVKRNARACLAEAVCCAAAPLVTDGPALPIHFFYHLLRCCLGGFACLGCSARPMSRCGPQSGISSPEQLRYDSCAPMLCGLPQSSQCHVLRRQAVLLKSCIRLPGAACILWPLQKAPPSLPHPPTPFLLLSCVDVPQQTETQKERKTQLDRAPLPTMLPVAAMQACQPSSLPAC